MSLKDDNTSVSSFLQNKLGSSTQLWSFSSTVVSQFTIEKLQAIKECFPTLDSIVKLKFLLTLFHIPKRNLDEFRPIIQELIENTLQSSHDQWVTSIAMFVKSYWLTQTLNTESEYDLESFNEAYSELKRILKEFVESEAGLQESKYLFPIECDYLNKNALLATFPNNTQLSNDILSQLTYDIMGNEFNYSKKHFNLVKTTKTLSQIDELKAKASTYSKSKTTTKSLLHTLNSGYGLNNNDSYSTTSTSSLLMSNKNKSSSSSFFSSRSSFGQTTASTTITGKSSNIKREGGIKFLDAQEQSATPKEAKRKRMLQEKETQKKLKSEQMEKEKLEKERLKQASSSSINSDESLTNKQNENISNEQVVSLNTDQLSNCNLDTNNKLNEISHNEMNNNKLMHSQLQFSSSNNFNNQSISDQENNTANNINNNINNNNNNNNNNTNITNNNNLVNFQPQLQTIQPLQQQYLHKQFIQETISPPNNFSQYHQPQYQQQQQNFPTLNAFVTNSNINNNINLTLNSVNSIQNDQFTPTKMFENNPSGFLFNNNSNNQHQFDNSPLQTFTTTLPSISPSISGLTQSTSPMAIPSTSDKIRQQQTNLPQQPHQQPQQQQTQSLSLTREQMLQAQEMFSNSNRLSRPEKALILGFIAGSRENPRPEHGSLISIKLNESEEILTSSNGQQHKVLSELYFQMNYDTGEYKKIKKLKPLVNL